MIEEVGDFIWRISSVQSGPTIVVFGGVHGNELTGIEVVRSLFRSFETDSVTLSCGTLYLILGNPKAMERQTRGSEDHADLNRCFTKSILEEQNAISPSYEIRRAHEIAKLLQHADISIDLHATNKPSLPFLACLADPAHEAVYKWLRCDRVLADPRYVLGGEPVTTDEFVDARGHIGICYETGQSSDTTRVQEVFDDIINLLKDQKMIEGDPVQQRSVVSHEVFELTSAIVLTENGFTFAEGRGTTSFEPIAVGEVIGYAGDQPVTAQEDGVIMFPKVKELHKIGKPVVYLAKRVS